MPCQPIRTASRVPSTSRFADGVGDWALIALRWVLYADLSVLFGLPLLLALVFGPTRDSPQSPSFRRSYGVLAAAGIAASVLGFLWQAAAMAGTTPSNLDTVTLSVLLTETSLGWALAARIIALASIMLFAATGRFFRHTSRSLTIAFAAVALATMAWSGHGAADEGLRGWGHLGVDIVHLLAAGAWLGALVAFLCLVVKGGRSCSQTIHRALASFAATGTVLVGVLLVTGLLNFYYVVGFGSFASSLTTPYVQLLLLKLVLFAGMLGLASLNRFRLTPSLAGAADEAARDLALQKLRRSLGFELSLGLGVIALVAWLGTLSPNGPI